MDSTNFKAAINQLQSNPMAILSLSLRALEEVSDGAVRFIDPSIPFVYQMENSVVLYCNALDKTLNTLNKLYEGSATTWDDLYRHMSSYDYEGRFSSPGSAPIMFWFDIQEIYEKAVPVNDGSGNRKLTIARNSQITISGVKLSFLYPVDIIVTAYNTIMVKYDTSIKNPLQKIATPDIAFEFRRSERLSYLFFELPLMQIEVNSSVSAVTETQGLKRSIKYVDQFYYLRAFMRNDDESWKEVAVTHNPMVIDIEKVTVGVKVLADRVEVSIPQVYLNKRMLKDNIRIDVYTCKGEVNIPLFNLNNTLFKANWIDHEEITKNNFAAPIGQFSNYLIASESYIAGGSNGVTFEEMRNRVINRSNVSEGLPITMQQIDTRLTNRGFDTMVMFDNVTDRDFLTTKMLTNDDNLTKSAIGSITTVHASTIDKLIENTVSVRDNSEQLTILPTALYEIVDGKLDMIPDQAVANLLDRNVTSIDELIAQVNSRRFYYSPYFWIHDFKNDQYVVKPYRFDKPRILTKSIENENSTIGFYSSIISYKIQVDASYTGYSIYVQINPSDLLKEEPIDAIQLQMRISDENERHFYWFNGELVTAIDPNTGKPINNEYVYRFALPTRWEINDSDELIIEPLRIPFKLDGNADIFTIVEKAGLGNSYRTSMDDMIKPNTLETYTLQNSADFYAVIQERVRIVLGRHLKHLWRRGRTTISGSRLVTYDQDTYDTYKETVFKKDQFGNDEFTIDSKGDLIYTVEHQKGSIKLDADGKQRLIGAKGGIVYDEKGNPTVISGSRGLVRQFDLVLLDAKYYFSTHDKTVEYREGVKDEIDGALDLIETFAPELLERTNLYYHPKITDGNLMVLVDGNEQISIPAGQSLEITYTVDERVSENAFIVEKIKKTTVSLIVDFIASRITISKADLITELKKSMNEWVFGINIDGWLNNQYDTVTVLDNSNRLTLPKRLAATTNLELMVEDDIRILFVTHSIATK